MTYGQNKYQYLKVDSYPTYGDSINYSIDASGINSTLKSTLSPILNHKIKFETDNELFNALGKMGWELYLIEDFPNTISQAKDNSSGAPIPEQFNLYRDWHYSNRKIYFKIKI